MINVKKRGRKNRRVEEKRRIADKQTRRRGEISG
jgi:hypothetical protein